METWAISPRDDGRPLRLLQLTDTHLFADPGAVLYGVNTRNSLTAVIAAIKRAGERPDAILVTGDLSQDESTTSYRILRDMLAQLEAPVFVLPGNHDDPAALRAIFDANAASYCGVIESGNWQIAMLSSWQEKNVGGLLEPSELERFAQVLERAGKRFTLACVHHQPVAIGSAWLDRIGLVNGDEFLAMAQRDERVRGILWGHVHQVFDEYRGRLRLLASPSTCRQFAPRSDQFANDELGPGWRWLSLFADGTLETEVQRLASEWAAGEPV
jgi:3',5'-cyclic-AMP phosphodiesterase